MVIVKLQIDDQVEYLYNEEESLGELKIHGNKESENLQIFLKSEISKRLLMFGCGYGSQKKDELEGKIKEDFASSGIDKYIKKDEKGILKIDTSDDGYIIDHLINEICSKYGIEATIVDEM